MRVFLFGNGLSVQPTGGRLRIRPLTEQLLEWLDAEGLKEEVGALVAWANPEHPEVDENELEENFEKIAGAVDRLSSAVATLATLPKDIAGTSDNLRQASSQLGRFYTRIVGCLLVSIDNILQSGTKWIELNAMGEAIWRQHELRSQVAIYTLNYDSLLMSAFMTARPNSWIYDGYPSLELDRPLDRWGGRFSLFALHGTLGTYQDILGHQRKRRLDDVRQSGLLEKWRDGSLDRIIPRVVLGDRKSASIEGEPFASFYAQMARDLGRPDTKEIVVGGYGFGDVPINGIIARFLEKSSDTVVRDWRPSATMERRETLARLRREVANGATIAESQLVSQDVELPSADAIASLP